MAHAIPDESYQVKPRFSRRFISALLAEIALPWIHVDRCNYRVLWRRHFVLPSVVVGSVARRRVGRIRRAPIGRRRALTSFLANERPAKGSAQPGGSFFLFFRSLRRLRSIPPSFWRGHRAPSIGRVDWLRRTCKCRSIDVSRGVCVCVRQPNDHRVVVGRFRRAPTGFPPHRRHSLHCDWFTGAGAARIRRNGDWPSWLPQECGRNEAAEYQRQSPTQRIDLVRSGWTAYHSGFDRVSSDGFVVAQCSLVVSVWFHLGNRIIPWLQHGNSIFNGFYLVSTEFYRVLPSFTEFYRVLPSFTKFYWALPSFTEFYRVLPSLLGFTEFYRVLPSFHVLYWVLLGFIRFHWATVTLNWVALGFTGSYRVFAGLCGHRSSIWQRYDLPNGKRTFGTQWQSVFGL